MRLTIGTKAWSSWSLRPWLALRRTGHAFEEVLIPLRWDGTTAAVAAASPSRRVPVLQDEGLTIWDSLAICEYLAEKFPAVHLWPAEPAARAVARSAAAEMHAGFAALRNAYSMDLALRTSKTPDDETAADIRRIVQLWADCRRRFGGAGGPWLFGAWSIADAFYAPVAARFRSYSVNLGEFGDADGAAAAYVVTALSDPDFLVWERDALADHPSSAVVGKQ